MIYLRSLRLIKRKRRSFVIHTSIEVSIYFSGTVPQLDFGRGCLCADTMTVIRGGEQHLSSSNDFRKNPERSFEPEFDLDVVTNVTSLAGQTAYLTCRIKNLGNRTVSWVRHRDIHILTTGTYTYTSDQRFQALHRPLATGSGGKSWSEWTLCIKWVQERDSGIYECQLSTAPVTSHAFRLSVVVPMARILSGPDLYVDAGSTLNLTCVIELSPEPLEYIFWYYNQKVLNYDSPNSRKFVYTERENEVTTSRLLIKSTDQEDSGEYSCRPSNSKKASVRVHVLNGERLEAMQTGGAAVPVLSLLLIVLSSSSNGFS
ncbi:cell adhesion molecule 2-like isoform X1 [Neodiprion pinetum]|uniref:Kin of IRRE-like protein 1 isoform X1 n=2 Tax=Neodiprion lecontei TaxID=441921 RepID=A0ABM3GDY4_NEOLC|nr:kin of IRRE-like protein 1 isoform X1 [Neodiprion pinetum]XP_046598483.1 kin of IRRE-like protein 1 isoform X1 [Neodiprion lecontei]